MNVEEFDKLSLIEQLATINDDIQDTYGKVLDANDIVRINNDVDLSNYSLKTNATRLYDRLAAVRTNLVRLLTDGGIAADETETICQLIAKIGYIGEPPGKEVWSVDLSLYKFTDEELERAKSILDFAFTGIWHTPEGEKILQMDGNSIDYNFDTYTNMVNANGYARPILTPHIKTGYHRGKVIPNGEALSSALFRANIDISDEKTDEACQGLFKYNYSLLEFPGGNWQEKCENFTQGAMQCHSIVKADLDMPKCSRISNAFEGCDNMEEIRLVVPAIWDSRLMFNGCAKLRKVYLDQTNNNRSDYTFEKCLALEHVTVIFGDNITNFNNVFAWAIPGNYFLLKGICMHRDATTLDLTLVSKWGTDKETGAVSDENRRTLTDTLITYSFDRASAGYPTATVSLHPDVKALLTEEEIARCTAKGYTIS